MGFSNVSTAWYIDVCVCDTGNKSLSLVVMHVVMEEFGDYFSIVYQQNLVVFIEISINGIIVY